MSRLIFLIICCLPLLLRAQYQWEGGLLLGGSLYQGDLSAPTLEAFQEVNPAYGFSLSRRLSTRFTARFSASKSWLSGNDANFSRLADRGFSFRTAITEATLQLEWSFFSPSAAGSRLFPYLSAGGGLLMTDPVVDFNVQPGDAPRSGIKEDLQAGGPATHFVLPLGAGLKIQLTERWLLGLEAGVRTAFTDYLDGVSVTGNARRGDWYGYGGLSAIYRWGVMDGDGDGIADAEDLCPEIAGKVIHQGCPDTDGDGFADREDDCPTAGGTLLGCPDTDADGIADHIDLCPYEAGMPALGGCPNRDQDGDGIEDGLDHCPTRVGPASRNGCPFEDRDKDGIEDNRDLCPDVAGSRSNYGCPEGG